MIRIKIPLAALILLLAHSFACSSRPGLEHFDRPEESSKVEIKNDGTAIIRSMHSEIAIRQIQDEEWENLIKFTPFINKKSEIAQYRVPRLKFFMACLKNTSEQPLILENVTLSYGDVSMDIMDSTKIKDTFKSDIFKFFNFDEILAPRRLVTEEENLEKINFDTDTVRYELSFIPPSDRLIRIITFPTIPVTVRSYRINFHLSYTGIKKIIAFDMQRFEYRTRGKYFIEKKQEYEDLP